MAMDPRWSGPLSGYTGRAKRAFGSVVRRFDALLVHEGKEVWKMEEERSREIPHIGVLCVDVAVRQREELPFNRQHLRDQLLTHERRAAGVRIASKAVPQAEEALLKGEGLAAKSRGRRRLGQLLRAEQVSREMRPTELTLPGGVRQTTGQPISVFPVHSAWHRALESPHSSTVFCR